MFGKKDTEPEQEIEQEVEQEAPKGMIGISFNIDIDIAKSLVGVGDEEEQGRFMVKAIAKALIEQKMRELETLKAKARELVR